MQDRYRRSMESRRKNGKPWHSETTKKKISESENNKKVSEETKAKLKLAWTTERKKHPNRKGQKHTDYSKKLLSEKTKKMWRNGVFDRKDYRSKGQIEVENLLKNMGYEVISEFIIDTKPFDIFLPKFKIVIEFNGTYWHLDKRFYSKDFFDKSRNISINEIRKRDLIKTKIAESQGYKALTIWQYDWEKTENKQAFLKEILYGTHSSD